MMGLGDQPEYDEDNDEELSSAGLFGFTLIALHFFGTLAFFPPKHSSSSSILFTACFEYIHRDGGTMLLRYPVLL